MSDWPKSLEDRQSNGDIREGKLFIKGLDVNQQTAIVKVNIIFNTFEFTDYLSLLKINKNWIMSGKYIPLSLELCFGIEQNHEVRHFIHLIRAVLPYWSFFDQVSSTYEIEYKTKDGKEWQKISFDEKRTLSGIFINPNVNMALAQINILEFFVQDFNDDKLLRSVIRTRINKQCPYQFRIMERINHERQEIYVSKWLDS